MLQTLRSTTDRVRVPVALGRGVVFWRAFALYPDGVESGASHTWEFAVGSRDRGVDTAWGGLHDFNGDGYDDIVVTSRLQRGPDRCPGPAHLYVYTGSSVGLLPTPASDIETPTNNTTDGIQFYVDTGGDFNGDGLGDWIVHSYGSSGYRNLWIFYGTRGRLPNRPDHIVADVLCERAFPGHADHGDVNGDGFSDLVTTSYGNYLVFLGSIEGLSDRGARAFFPLDSYGASSLRDLDHDGFDDFQTIMASEMVLMSIYWGGERYVGDWPASAAFPVVGGRTLRGYLHPLGDLDGDGVADAWFSVGNSVGVVRGTHGRREVNLVQEVSAPERGVPYFGDGSSSGGDLDGDGLSDLAVGAPTAPLEPRTEFDGPGRVYVFLATDGRISPTPNAILAPPPGGGYFGRGVTIRSDVNGDGVEDLVAGPVYSGGYSIGLTIRLGSAKGLGASTVLVAPALGTTFGEAIH
ncbi:MAG: VCBS repeat-containing protein [Deltaproteobacteria bacterium]|nr:VCBS repeat-containing protein [Deltaproteobacteria bacterium]